MAYTYVIYGIPQQQERPRATSIRGKVRVYDPPKSRAYKQYLQQQLTEHYKPTLLERPLTVTLKIFVPIPKSYTKKQRQAIENGVLYPAKKPDLSNYIKIIEDAFNGYLYKDDGLIVEMTASKHYSETPRIELTLHEL